MKKSRRSSTNGTSMQAAGHVLALEGRGESTAEGQVGAGAPASAPQQATEPSPRRSKRLALKRGDSIIREQAASSQLGTAAEAAEEQQVELHHGAVVPPTTNQNLVVLWTPRLEDTPNPGTPQPYAGGDNTGPLPAPASTTQLAPGSLSAADSPTTAGAQHLQQQAVAPGGGDEGAAAGAAIRSGLLQNISVDGALCTKQCAPQPDGDSSGLWGLLPDELLEIILRQCAPAQLAMLESTCHFFHDSKLIEKIAKHKLKSVPRARGLRPNRKDGETYTMLLHYVNCQSAAAAQATSIACGAYHTAALLISTEDEADPAAGAPARHSLYTFGRGFHGQLGNAEHDSQRAPVQVSLGFKPCAEHPDVEEETMPAVVACGAHHTTAISRKGELYAWGLGCHGELGLGRWGPIELALPRQCSSPSVRIVSVACGAHHTLAIAESGTLWSCGKNRHGQLGNTTMVDSSRLQMVMHLSGYRIVSSAAGAAHSMALASDGSLFTWGDGSRGQLGHTQLQGLAAMMPAGSPITMPTSQKINRLDPIALAPEHRVTAIAAGAHFSMALTVGGSILAFGANDDGQLGTGDTVDRWKPTRVVLPSDGEDVACLRVVQLACGLRHSVALVSCQGRLQVRTAGANAHGQLGHGDRCPRDLFQPIAKLPNVVAVQAGDEHSAAVTASGELHLWGRGDSGQLGLADARAKWKPTPLKDFRVVHPDKTLRRNKRNQPYTRPVAADVKQGTHVGTPLM